MSTEPLSPAARSCAPFILDPATTRLDRINAIDQRLAKVSRIVGDFIDYTADVDQDDGESERLWAIQHFIEEIDVLWNHECPPDCPSLPEQLCTEAWEDIAVLRDAAKPYEKLADYWNQVQLHVAFLACKRAGIKCDGALYVRLLKAKNGPEAAWIIAQAGGEVMAPSAKEKTVEGVEDLQHARDALDAAIEATRFDDRDAANTLTLNALQAIERAREATDDQVVDCLRSIVSEKRDEDGDASAAAVRS